jgi:hypothetical protein
VNGGGHGRVYGISGGSDQNAALCNQWRVAYGNGGSSVALVARKLSGLEDTDSASLASVRYMMTTQVEDEVKSGRPR